MSADPMSQHAHSYQAHFDVELRVMGDPLAVTLAEPLFVKLLKIPES